MSFRTKLVFYGVGLLAPRPTPKLEDHPLSFVRGCLFNIFAVSLHPQLEDVPCSGDEGTHLSLALEPLTFLISNRHFHKVSSFALPILLITLSHSYKMNARYTFSL
jgi:hypothetical protein